MGGIMQKKEIVAGDILFAERALDGSYFENRVILIANSTEDDGCFGFVLNAPARLPIREVFSPVPTGVVSASRQFFLGGPVDEDELFMLELGSEEQNRGGEEITKNVYFGGFWQEIEELLDAPEDQLLLFLGYAGWAAGQLEDELAEGSWSKYTGLNVAHLLALFQQKKTLDRKEIMQYFTLCR